ncbi:hypothetical protein WA026_014177 [Henosepilachna vigintioctopunctata]|uniref:Uncharacterized protein n=1 Tax=Henosepilachna vigintioctopunctata TaxID=420089 RepID=A0AAW1TSX3_9CUCU
MYVIFPADEVVYLSYGRVIYIPSSPPSSENQSNIPIRTSYSSGSHVSYPSIPSTSTNSSTRSHHSTKSLPVVPSKADQLQKSNSLSSLSQCAAEKEEDSSGVIPKRKKEFPFKLSSLLTKSKRQTPTLERKLSFSDFFNIAKERRERSVESVRTPSSDARYQTTQKFKTLKDDQVLHNGSNYSKDFDPLTRPSILKSGKCASNRQNKSPCLMIRETDVFNFEQPGTSKTHSPSSAPKYNNHEPDFQSKSTTRVSSSSSNKSVDIKPIRKISSEKSPQIKITSERSTQRPPRDKLGGSKGLLTRSLSLKPNSSQYYGETSERDYREVTPPTNSSREKSPPGKIPSDKKQLSKSLYNKPVKLLKKPLQFSKSFKEITTAPPAKSPTTPTTPNPSKKSPSSKSLTIDFDSLFRRETSPAKVSLKNLAPKFEDDNSRKTDEKKTSTQAIKRGGTVNSSSKNGNK